MIRPEVEQRQVVVVEPHADRGRCRPAVSASPVVSGREGGGKVETRQLGGHLEKGHQGLVGEDEVHGTQLEVHFRDKTVLEALPFLVNVHIAHR